MIGRRSDARADHEIRDGARRDYLAGRAERSDPRRDVHRKAGDVRSAPLTLARVKAARRLEINARPALVMSSSCGCAGSAFVRDSRRRCLLHESVTRDWSRRS